MRVIFKKYKSDHDTLRSKSLSGPSRVSCPARTVAAMVTLVGERCPVVPSSCPPHCSGAGHGARCRQNCASLTVCWVALWLLSSNGSRHRKTNKQQHQKKKHLFLTLNRSNSIFNPPKGTLSALLPFPAPQPGSACPEGRSPGSQ